MNEFKRLKYISFPKLLTFLVLGIAVVIYHQKGKELWSGHTFLYFFPVHPGEILVFVRYDVVSKSRVHNIPVYK